MSFVTLDTQLVDSWRLAATHFARPLKDPDIHSQISRMIHRDRAFMKQVWVNFNTERTEISDGYLNDKAQLSAYLMGFHLPNVARMQTLIEKTTTRHPQLLEQISGAPAVRIFDLGAGTGAASQALTSFLAKNDIPNVTTELYDTSRPALKAAEHIYTNLNLPATYKTTFRALRLEAFEPRFIERGHFHIVMMSYVWNELYKNAKAKQRILRHFATLSQQGPLLLFFSEPANESHAKFMMSLRDELNSPALTPLYPCAHSALCPMQKTPRDWCFTESQWQRPAEVELIDRLLKLDRGHISHAGFTFTNMKPATQGAAQKVVVGRPRDKNTGEVSYLLCGEGRLTRSPAPQKGPKQLRGNIFK